MTQLDGFREGSFAEDSFDRPLLDVPFRHNTDEGSRVTVTLTGRVIGRGLSFISILIDGQEESAEKIVYVERSNQKVVIR